MKERPILFSGPMVRAILEGRKTQTRRVVDFTGCRVGENPSDFHMGREVFNRKSGKTYGPFGLFFRPDPKYWFMPDKPYTEFVRCPYVQPGPNVKLEEWGRLWVRESGYKFTGVDPSTAPKWRYAADPTHADNQTGPPSKNNLNDYTRWASVPSIHMPRWASRITLEVTEVRVQRLQEISEEDAKAEGVEPDSRFIDHFISYADRKSHYPSARGSFSSLWDSINGQSEGCAWKDNPWVWAVSFKRVTA
jgi:hypothetical protein